MLLPTPALIDRQLSQKAILCDCTFLAPMAFPNARAMVTLGMFIIDEFEYNNLSGEPTGQRASSEANYSPEK